MSMKNIKFKRLASFLLAAVTAVSCKTAVRAENADCPAITPPENVFRVRGSQQSFILLDTEGSDTSKFFILAKDFYGSKPFDKNNSQILNPAGKDNIAGYLNGDFLAADEGSGGLCADVKKYIDSEHEWTTNAPLRNGEIDRDYKTVMGVNLLSLAEYNKYKKKIGCRDNSTDAWFLRSGLRFYTSSHYMHCVSVTPSADNIINRTPQTSMAIRPAFYLSRDFFKNVKLDLEKTGGNVKRTVAALYSAEELKNAGYTEAEIKSLHLGELVKITPLYDEYESFRPGSVRFAYEAELAQSKARSYKLHYTVTDLFREAEIKYDDISVNVGGGTKATGSFSCAGLSEGSYRIKVTLTDGSRTAAEYEKDFSVFSDYTDKFMDVLTPWGVCSQFNYDPTADGLRKRTALMTKSGIKTVRGAVSWFEAESETKGSYDWATLDRLHKHAQQSGMNYIACLGYNNTLYGAKNIRDGVMTEEQRLGLAKYILLYIERLKNVGEIETWNEPDMDFWTKDGGNYFADLAQLQKYIYNVVKERYPDVAVDGACTALTYDTKLLQGLFDNGAYPYMDAVALHAYNQPLPISRAFYTRRYANHAELISESGGWKRMVITETGTPTGSGNVSVSENQQAKDIAKAYLLSDLFGIDKCMIYTFADRGTNPKNAEDMFGIVRNDYSLKPAYISAKTARQKLAGAVYIGEVKLGENIVALMYADEGKPVLAAWCDKAGETADISLHGRDLTVCDTLGKTSPSNGQIRLTDAPCYISGIDKAFLLETAKENITEKIAAFMSEFGEELMEERKAELAALKSAAAAETNALSLMQLLYGEGEKLAAERNAQSDMRHSQMLFEWFGACKISTALYAAEENAASLGISDESVQRVGTLAAMRSADRQNGYIHGYSDAMHEYAKYMKGRADKVMSSRDESSVKQSAADAYSFAALQLCKWAERFRAYEAAENGDLIIYPKGKDLVKYEGVASDIRLQLINTSDKTQSGAVRLVTSGGKLNSQTERITVKAGRTAETAVTFDGNISSDDNKYFLEFIGDDGAVTKREPMSMSLTKAIELAALPSEKSFEELTEISVLVINNSDKEIPGKVKLTPPAGWQLESNEMSFTVSGGGETTVTFSVIGKTAAQYNFYAFEAEAKSEISDKTTALKYPLSFLTVAKAENEMQCAEFDGSIGWWKDAYPIYLAPPSEPSEEASWSASDIAGRLFMKWDKDNIYILADVYDDFYVQNNSGQALWNGDSIQFQFDTQNDKATSYKSDDLEIGYAWTEKGPDCFIWNSAAGEEPGAGPSDSAKIVRRQDIGALRYFIKLPKSVLGYREITTETLFGFNAVINDADFDTRETMSVFTKGLGESKNPSLAYTFRLLSGASDAAENSDVKAAVPE